MKIDANAICYLLMRDFDDVVGHIPSHGPLVDYPMLYDESNPVSGHSVLIPDQVEFGELAVMEDVVCVCVGEESTRKALERGYPVIHVRGGVTLQHLHNTMQSVFVQHERLDAQLRAYIEAYAGFRPMLDAFAETMGCACTLVNSRFELVWQADGRPSMHPGSEPILDEATVDLLMASQEYRRRRASRKVYSSDISTDLFMKNIFAKDQLVGTLAIVHDGTLPSARYARFLLEYLTPFVEEMYMRRGSFGTASVEAARVRSLILRAFNGEAIDFEELESMIAGAEPHGVARFTVLRFVRSFTHGGVEELEYLAQRIEVAWPEAYCVLFEGCLFALVELGRYAHGQESDFLQEMTVFARNALSKVGMSRVFSSCRDLAAGRMQATAALDQGNVIDPTYWFYRFDEYALDWLIAFGQQGYPAEYVAHPALAVLRRYDLERGSSLVDTLRAFIRCRYNATEASQSLFVSRSTLLNRLARIGELADVDLDDPRERIYLAISFNLLR